MMAFPAKVSHKLKTGLDVELVFGLFAKCLNLTERETGIEPTTSNLGSSSQPTGQRRIMISQETVFFLKPANFDSCSTSTVAILN